MLRGFVLFGDDFACVGIFAPIASARHSRPAPAAELCTPSAIGMVFTDPPDAKTNGTHPWLVVALAVLVRGGARWRRTTHCAKSVAGPPFRHGVPQTNSPSCQSRNASKARLGVQASIMPKNTACKVVISFRSLDVTFAQDKRFGRLSVAVPDHRSKQRSVVTSAYRGAQ